MLRSSIGRTSRFLREKVRVRFPHGVQKIRGSAEVGESGRTVNPLVYPEWVRFPPPSQINADEHDTGRVAGFSNQCGLINLSGFDSHHQFKY